MRLFAMKLDDAQRKKVAGWIDEGLKLSDIQKRVDTELGLTLTYMEVRLLVDDLKLVPKDPTPPPAPVVPPSPGPKPAPGGGVPGNPGGHGLPSFSGLPPIPGMPPSAKPGAGPSAAPASVPAPPLSSLAPPPGGGLTPVKVIVGVDTVARPGAMVSGSVTFSDGQKGAWYLDQYGRLGVAPEKPGYKPTPSDVETFQMELEKELSRYGF